MQINSIGNSQSGMQQDPSPQGIAPVNPSITQIAQNTLNTPQPSKGTRGKFAFEEGPETLYYQSTKEDAEFEKLMCHPSISFSQLMATHITEKLDSDITIATKQLETILDKHFATVGPYILAFKFYPSNLLPACELFRKLKENPISVVLLLDYIYFYLSESDKNPSDIYRALFGALLLHFLKPESYLTQLALARIFFTLGSPQNQTSCYQRALVHAKKALSFANDKREIHNLLGKICFTCGDFEKAFAMFHEVIKASKQFPKHAFVNIVQISRCLDHTLKYRQLVVTLVDPFLQEKKLTDEFTQQYSELVFELLVEKSEFEQAESLLAVAKEKFPFNIHFLRGLEILLRIQENKLNIADTLLQDKDFQKNYPRSWHYFKGLLYEKQEEYDKALKEYDEALSNIKKIIPWSRNS